MKVFVIPDIHLKPWMLERADAEVSRGDYDRIVFLGDFVDDWGEGQNIDLYNETFDAIRDFIMDHPNTLICYGNHDISYVWGAMESGYSPWARDTVITRLQEIRRLLPAGNSAFIHRIDKVLFSHAGLSRRFAEKTEEKLRKRSGAGEVDIDRLIKYINTLGEEELWSDPSPLWCRPQLEPEEMYPKGYLQVVGHTPVYKPELKGDVLTLDVFSTKQNGNPIGNERFVWIDTKTQKFGVVGSESPNDSIIRMGT